MNVERVEALAKLLAGSRARELTVETAAWRVALRRAPERHATAPTELPASPALPAAGDAEADREFWVTAPLVGLFRQSSPAVAAGDQVSEGQIVGAIESMKILSPLVSEHDGEVTELLVEEGQPVEFGQPLLQIRTLR
jgi:acetyl-CoA carboxylase biotin carboxyl carrier protein